MAEKAVKKNLQPTTMIAKIFMVTPERIRQLMKDGVFDGELVKGNYQFDLLPTIQKYIKYLSDKAYDRESKGRNVEEMEADKLQAEIELKQSKAEIAKLELEEVKGNMHRAEDVEAMTTDLCLNVRSNLLSLPGRLAMDIVEAKTPSEASEMIKKEVCAILEDLSRYEYNPDEYKRLVRERQGWQEREELEDEL